MPDPARNAQSTDEAGSVVTLLAELVRCRSVTPDDAGCQSILIERLQANGFACESLPFGDVSNLWACHGDNEPVLCFAGHTDVVPPGPDGLWDSEPFEPDIRDGMLYGRGAADMKSGLAAMVVAAERFLAIHPDHRGSIAFLITSDEEGEARNGTRRVIETLEKRNEKMDWCVIGEPSSRETLADEVRIGRRGSLSGVLTVTGSQGHVAYPHLADNPIVRFAPVLAELLDTAWDDGNEHFPATSFQVTDIRSGAAASNVIPGELTARFNFRYSTEWDHGELAERTEQILREHELEYELEWQLSGEPFLTQGGTLIEAVTRAVSELAGCAPATSTGGGTSDGRFIAPTGADVVELGPVNASIHKVNEHVRIADVQKLADIYERIMEIMLL